MQHFRVGDRVEVASGEYIGQRGTVRYAALEIVFVQLDHQLSRPTEATVIDLSGDQSQLASAFHPTALRPEGEAARVSKPR
jgi:hypothetical protein